MSPENLSIICSGTFLLTGLMTGVWKFRQVRAYADHQAHPYVDIAHRAALMYSFACIVLAEFAKRSPLSDFITLLCVLAPIVFFAVAIAAYIYHGLKQDTENQFANPKPLTINKMYTLIITEIGEFRILFPAVTWNTICISQ